MKRMDRRKFMLVASVGGTGAVLVACGNDPDDIDLDPTIIPVEGAPPTLAPMATPGGGAVEEGETDSGGTDTPAEGVVALEASDPFNWSIYDLEAAPGQTIQATNIGVMEHDFVIDELGISEMLPSGEPIDIVLPDDLEIGATYEFYCSIPGHRESGMEGTLTIVEAGEPAAVADEGGEEAEPDGAAAGNGAEMGPVLLEAHDPFAWSVYDLEAAPGQTIQITNTGVMEHDFVIDELDISEMLPRGEAVVVTLPQDLTIGDSYEFYCSIPGHRQSGMEGTLNIVEESAQTVAPEEASDAAAAAAEDVPADDELYAIPAETVALLDDPAVVAIEATDPYNWSKKSIAAYPGQVVRALNRGVLEHDFVIDEFEIAQMLPFGEVIDIQIPSDAPIGEAFAYYCSIPGHRERGMEGHVTIIEADESAATPVAAGEATPAEEAAPAGGGETSFDVTAVDIAFEPSELTIPANTDVTINLTNEGVLEHDLVLDDLDVGTDLLPSGQAQSITVNAAPGTYEFHCTVAGHREAGMVGTLTVE